MSTRLQTEPRAAGAARRSGRRRRLMALAVLAMAVLVAAGILLHDRLSPTGPAPQPAAGGSAAPSAAPSTPPANGRPTPLALQGFARGTSGGQGGRLVSVTSLADAGPGTLRA